ncbi:MAG: hypothetical protein ABSH22_06465, partial [Tepidisphaeraceae bacterium]
MIDQPRLLVIALLLAAATMAVIVLRGADLRGWARGFFFAGLIFLAVACGKPVWISPSVEPVAVMVDLSPSTRGAAYRDPTLLRRRLGELLGATPYQLFFFAQKTTTGSLETAAPLAEMPADETDFNPPPAAAIVLFSDGRFSASGDAPSIYPVLDPMLENTADAAITGMNISGDNVFVSVTNNGPPRTLTLHGVAGPTTFPVTANETIVRPIARGADRILAELSGSDLWPENNAMSI